MKEYLLRKYHAIISMMAYLAIIAFWFVAGRRQPIAPATVTQITIGGGLLTVVLVSVRAQIEGRLASYYARYGLWYRMLLFILFVILPVGDLVYLVEGKPAKVFPLVMDIPKISLTGLVEELRKQYFAAVADVQNNTIILLSPTGEMAVQLQKIGQVELVLPIDTENEIVLPAESDWRMECSGGTKVLFAEISYLPEFKEKEIAVIIVRAVDQLREILL